MSWCEHSKLVNYRNQGPFLLLVICFDLIFVFLLHLFLLLQSRCEQECDAVPVECVASHTLGHELPSIYPSIHPFFDVSVVVSGCIMDIDDYYYCCYHCFFFCFFIINVHLNTELVHRLAKLIPSHYIFIGHYLIFHMFICL